jgi:hypothetical protein
LKHNSLIYVETNSFIQLRELLNECEERKTAAAAMAQAARSCGYKDSHPVIKLAQEEWNAANKLALAYQEKLNQTKWLSKWKEYPVATEVWIYLTEIMQYSNYVAAGIMGNMMVESGGLTLNLDWTATNSSSKCYGLCQWHPTYHYEVQGANLQEQLRYMATSFPKTISIYAHCYSTGFSYGQFLEMTNVREVAKAFCLIYERPGGYNNRRGDCAVKAYDYFVN